MSKALEEALATLEKHGIVDFNVTIEGDSAKMLAAMLEPALDGDDPTPIRLMSGNGHSGYGIYVADDEYPEEGAELLVNITQPMQPKQEQGEPVAVALNTGTKQGVKWLKNVEHGENLYTTPQQRTWVGLTDEEANELWESTDSDWELMKRVEAKLKEKNT